MQRAGRHVLYQKTTFRLTTSQLKVELSLGRPSRTQKPQMPPLVASEMRSDLTLHGLCVFVLWLVAGMN